MGKLTDTLKTLIQNEMSQAPIHSKGQKRARLIAVCSQKGGVGKTTTAVNLGTGLVKYHNQSVLIIDLDPQGHVEKSLNGLIEEGIDYTPLSEIFLKKKSDLLDGVVHTKWNGLDITPGDKTLYETEGQLSAKLGREYILQTALDRAIRCGNVTSESVYDKRGLLVF